MGTALPKDFYPNDTLFYWYKYKGNPEVPELGKVMEFQNRYNNHAIYVKHMKKVQEEKSEEDVEEYAKKYQMSNSNVISLYAAFWVPGSILKIVTPLTWKQGTKHLLLCFEKFDDTLGDGIEKLRVLN